MLNNARSMKNKRAFDMHVFFDNVNESTAIGLIGVLCLSALVIRSNNSADNSLCIWAACSISFLIIKNLFYKVWPKNNRFALSNFWEIRNIMLIGHMAIYLSSVILFFTNLDRGERLIFCVIMLAIAIFSIVNNYVLIAKFVAGWTLIWMSLIYLNDDREIENLLLVLMIVALSVGLYISSTLKKSMLLAFECQEKLNIKSAEIKSDNKHLKMFLIAANHDLAQPLTAIQYGIKALSYVKFDDPLTVESINNMREATVTLSRLIGDIVHFEKISSGMVKVEHNNISIQSIFDKVVSQVEQIATEKGIGIWARPTERTANSDPFIIERILRNLVENAIRNTSVGRVIIAARPKGKSISLEVWDTGIGIEPDNIDSVFDLFYQNKRSGTAAVGHGIGLSIVRTLANKLGATVVVNSIPDKGTVFKVILPPPEMEEAGCKKDSFNADQNIFESSPSKELFHEPMNWNGLNIALLEDSKELRSAMEMSFIEKKANVVSAASSFELLNKIDGEAKNIDVLITDWNLGFENGEQARMALTNVDGFQAHWIVISGDMPQGDFNRLSEAHIPILCKPFSPEKMFRLIDEIYLTLSRPGS